MILCGGTIQLRPDYTEKFTRLRKQTRFDTLDESTRAAIRTIAMDNFLTQQELKTVVDASIDLEMWGEMDLVTYWKKLRDTSNLHGREFKKWALKQLDDHMKSILRSETEYLSQPAPQTSYRPLKLKISEETAGQKIFGMCPVKSEKTLCCNLRTIDAVKNCGFGCSYCSIQTMYTDQNIIFDHQFRQKLEAIELDPERHYHIGTGQSSDSMMWGNKNNILGDMFNFARKWPKALIELKTKSDNIKFLLQSDVPFNVVCSWSLNPDVIIRNEEHLTADLHQRLDAARTVADKNIRVAFHLHPMIHYRGWRRDYRYLIGLIMKRFLPREIVFISFGALTFPRPIINKLRTYGIGSKINQTTMVPNPEGKLTYPDEIKTRLFSLAYEAFRDWHGSVFFYLCMEDPKFWDSAFGMRYPDNETMEAELMKSAWSKLL